jgi:hypothetical protein
MSIKAVARTIVLTFSILAMSGCRLVTPYDPSGFHYVYEKGDGPAGIAEWALKQDDPERVLHAQLALGGFTDPPHLPEQAAKVAEGVDAFVRINEAYHAGWQFKPTTNTQANPRFIPGRCYDSVAEAASFNEYARTRFLAMEPPEHSEFHEQWIAAGRQFGVIAE